MALRCFVCCRCWTFHHCPTLCADSTPATVSGVGGAQVTPSGVSVQGTTDESGTAFCAVYPASAAVPAASDVINTGAQSNAVAGAFTVTISGVANLENKVAYCVVRDESLNVGAVVASSAFAFGALSRVCAAFVGFLFVSLFVCAPMPRVACSRCVANSSPVPWMGWVSLFFSRLLFRRSRLGSIETPQRQDGHMGYHPCYPCMRSGGGCHRVRRVLVQLSRRRTGGPARRQVQRRHRERWPAVPCRTYKYRPHRGQLRLGALVCQYFQARWYASRHLFSVQRCVPHHPGIAPGCRVRAMPVVCPHPSTVCVVVLFVVVGARCRCCEWALHVSYPVMCLAWVPCVWSSGTQDCLLEPTRGPVWFQFPVRCCRACD